MMHLISRGILSDLLQMISANWQDYTSNHSSSRVMTDAANLARRTRWIVGIQTFSVLSYAVGVLATNANSPERLEPYRQELILKM